jgi:alkylation response protein AidB-like acyl-CoA dehydrogenase
MDLSYSPEEQAFEAEVRAFLASHLPEDVSRRVLARQEITREDMARWHAILNEKGWLAGPWPEEFGGQAWGPVEAHIFEEECCRAGAPRIVPFGLKMLGPVLMKFGSAGAAGGIPAPHPRRSRLVVPGLFGTRRGVGSGEPEDTGGARRRPLYRQRAEDLDDAMANTPTASSALCARRPTASRRRGFPSF